MSINCILSKSKPISFDVLLILLALLFNAKVLYDYMDNGKLTDIPKDNVVYDTVHHDIGKP